MHPEPEFEPLPDWPRTVFLDNGVQYDLIPAEVPVEVDGHEITCFVSAPTSLSPAQLDTVTRHVEETHGVAVIRPDADRPMDAPFRMFPLLLRDG